MTALGLFILLGVVFLLGLFLGVRTMLQKKQSWWAEKVIWFVKRYTNAADK